MQLVQKLLHCVDRWMAYGVHQAYLTFFLCRSPLKFNLAIWVNYIIYNCCLILSWWMAWSHNISARQCILGCECSICWIHGGHGTWSPLWGPRSYMTCRSCKSSVAICNMSKWHCVTCFHSRRDHYWLLVSALMCLLVLVMAISVVSSIITASKHNAAE